MTRRRYRTNSEIRDILKVSQRIAAQIQDRGDLLPQLEDDLDVLEDEALLNAMRSASAAAEFGDGLLNI